VIIWWILTMDILDVGFSWYRVNFSIGAAFCFFFSPPREIRSAVSFHDVAILLSSSPLIPLITSHPSS
jgi:hypothetical protein